jgi:hypothetical protein
MKTDRKHTQSNQYIGRVGGRVLQAGGRTKREAVKRLRLAFARIGVQTIPEALTDLLEVSPAKISRV